MVGEHGNHLPLAFQAKNRHHGGMTPKSGAALFVAAVLLAGCSEPVTFVDPDSPAPALPPTRSVLREGIEYGITVTALRADVVAVDLVVRNRGHTARTVRFADSCVGALRAYRHSSGELAWDQREGKPGCQPQAREALLPPGGSLTAVARAGSLGILGWTLPEGDYRITVVVQPAEAPEIEIEVGVTRLERPL
jgi:hypothetical protein